VAATYSGTSPGSAWTDEKLVLPALDGQAAVRLRFRLETDGGGAPKDGWHVDDVGLYGTGPGCTAAFMPSAGFTTTIPVAPGEPVTFTNTTTGLEPLAFEWDFGDGLGTSVARHPVYTYISSGTFTVTLVATNAVGSDVATGTIHIEAPTSYHYLYLPIVRRDS
jgi:PKD repeat protein